jgi:hypothetical protein
MMCNFQLTKFKENVNFFHQGAVLTALADPASKYQKGE